MNKAISVSRSEGDVFVHIPVRLDVPYLECVLSRALGRDVKIAECTAANLCGGKWRVSNSGSTVLRLSLTLSDGGRLDLVAKILSPDPWNIFKIDVCFSSRLAEVACAQWWGRQDVTWVPVTYDTRADPWAREFWIIHEYFPQVGWQGQDVNRPKDLGRVSADGANLRHLLHQVALLHAHSRLKIDELRTLFPPDGGLYGGSCSVCSPATVRSWLARATDDSAFLSAIGVSDQERESLRVFGEALDRVPQWVQRWDEVCVTSDWAPDNFGIRPGREADLVTFDWGTTHLGPMEEDVAIVLVRLKGVGAEDRRLLLTHYLDVYGERTARRIDIDDFLLRIPWARFFTTLRMLVGHVEALRWIPHQTRSREFIHLCIGLGTKQLEDCRATRPNR